MRSSFHRYVAGFSFSRMPEKAKKKKAGFAARLFCSFV